MNIPIVKQNKATLIKTKKEAGMATKKDLKWLADYEEKKNKKKKSLKIKK